jgi:molybdopterin-guanine dinucleotide biosynthesis protein A
MGRDKAFVTVEGEELVARAANALTSAGATAVTVVGGDAPRLSDLGLPHRVDRFPGAGPLGGIITALAHFAEANDQHHGVVILACDLINPSPDAVRAVATALEDPTVDVAIPVADSRAQWLHGAWRIRSLATLAEAFDQGTRAPKDAVARLTVHQLHSNEQSWFRDADRPEDLPGNAAGAVARYDLPAPQED